MATIRLVNAVKHALLTPLKTAIDAGSTGGTIKLYTGTIPVDPSGAVTGTLLGTLTFGDPCCTTIGSPNLGAMDMNAITQDSEADADGVAGYARIADSTGVTVCDVDVSNTGGGGVIQLNTTNIKAGGPILITAFKFYL